jgi:hypothetical protein
LPHHSLFACFISAAFPIYIYFSFPSLYFRYLCKNVKLSLCLTN